MHSDFNNADEMFEIGAGDLDCSAIMERIRRTVARKREEGEYDDARIALAERYNLDNLRGDETFLDRYLDSLREAVQVDINDYIIRERRRWAGGSLVAMKRLIWKMLKFYTYRLWSQQNQVNSLLLAAVEETDRLYRERLEKLEVRIQALEKKISD